MKNLRPLSPISIVLAVMVGAAFSGGGVSASPTSSAVSGLCHSNETPVFQCAVGSKRLSLCAAEPQAVGSVQYRFGTPAKIEMQYPQEVGRGPQTMRYAMTGYSGGGETQVQFESGDVRYVVYSRMVRTGFGPDGLHYPKDFLGVAVFRNGKLIADRSCSKTRIIGGKDDWIDESMVKKLLPESDEFIDVHY